LCIEEKKKELLAQYHFKFITQRSTGRQKQARFLPIGKLLVKERYHPKENPFSLLPPVSLVVIHPNLNLKTKKFKKT